MRARLRKFACVGRSTGGENYHPTPSPKQYPAHRHRRQKRQMRHGLHRGRAPNVTCNTYLVVLEYYNNMSRHALNTARIAPRPRPQSPDGLPLRKPLAFAQTARVRRDMTENRRKIHSYLF